MANYYKVSPENLQELMTDHIREVIDQLDKGYPVLIAPIVTGKQIGRAHV